MPTDPQTGKRLPGKAGMYAGEPGAPADAPPMPEGEGAGPDMPAEIVPERDFPKLAAEADAVGMMGEELDTVEKATAPQAEGAAMEDAPMEGGMDVGPIAEALGVDDARAMEIYEASQQMPRLEGKPVEEIASMLAEDIDLRMQVEKLAARTVDQAVEDEALEPVGEGAPAGEMAE
jgi:hypothetical protein